MTIEEKAESFVNEWLWFVKDLEMERKTDPKPEYVRIKEAYIAGAKENGIVWHDLRINPDDLPKVDMLVRVRLSGGMEHICETDYYEPSEDEIGYGKLIISFYELNGEWIDDTEIIAWCEIPKFKEE